MRVDLDAKVGTSDGQDAGSVQRVVVDPRSTEVTDFVISTGGLSGTTSWCQSGDRARQRGRRRPAAPALDEGGGGSAYRSQRARRLRRPAAGWVLPRR